jgi:hypothetical protein
MVVVGLVVGASAPAFALKPAAHADVTQRSCQAAGLPKDACTRIATEDYDTDEREWDDLRAHAQIEDNETACAAADRTASRMWSLGAELRTRLAAFARSGSYDDAGAVDAAIGRALHTAQDDCAHHGMPNPQHAWSSLHDFCDGTATNPDVQSDAIACARTESDAILKTAATAIRNAGLTSRLGALSCPDASGGGRGGADTPVCQGRWLPTPFEACAFLGRANDWDGIDRTWSNAVVAPALRSAFAAGVTGALAPAAGAICHGDERVLSNATSRPMADVSGGTPSCLKAHVLCLGKADDGGDVENPFADDPVDADAGGCAATGGAGLGMLIPLTAFVRRRRR